MFMVRRIWVPMDEFQGRERSELNTGAYDL